MDWNGLEKYFWEVSKIILGSTIAMGIIAFTAKSYVEQILKRGLERYKVELAKEISIFNHHLSKISEIYARAAKAALAFSVDKRRYWERCVMSGEEYLTHINEHMVVLDASLIKRIQPLNEKFQNILLQIDENRPRPASWETHDEVSMEELYKQGGDVIKKIVILLEAEVRKEQARHN